MSVCLAPSAIFFLQFEKWRILRSNAFASNSVSNWGVGGNFYGSFPDDATDSYLRYTLLVSFSLSLLQLVSSVHVSRQKIAYGFRTSFTRATFPTNLFLLDLIALIVFGQSPRYTTFFMRSELFWDITQFTVVTPYRRFGTSCRPHLQGSRNLRFFTLVPKRR